MSSELNSQLPPLGSPQPPQNSFVFYSYEEANSLYVQWDDPSTNPFNSSFDIQGVNVYRSFDSELGPYTKINTDPVQVGYYRDAMTHESILEDVSAKFIYTGTGPSNEWLFETSHRMVKDSRTLNFATTPDDIELTIDGTIVPAHIVYGEQCKVKLIDSWYMNKHTREKVLPILPKEGSVVTCKYLRNTNNIDLSRHARIFYKLTTVSSDKGESPVHLSPAICQQQIESWDYVWSEAVRRNRWILQQAGEDCKVMLRKWFGDRCSCYSPVHRRAETDCKLCWGTGILGGYVGPFPFKMAPVDSETKLEREEGGLRARKTSVLWSNYAPRLNTFDLIYRKNGEIFIVGYVKHAEVRGNSFPQYEFNATLLERTRVEYLIPLNNPIGAVLDVQFVSNHPPTPDGQEVKGRTVTFENWTT